MSNTLLETEQVPLWEKLPQEGPKAFEAFCVYRDMKPRSVLKAYRQKTSNKTAARVSGSWNEWTAEFRWSDRVEAYDAYIERIARQKREEVYINDLEDFRKRQRQVAQASLGISANMLQQAHKRLEELKANKENIPLNQLPALVRAAAHLAEFATNAEAQALGVEEILKSLAL